MYFYKLWRSYCEFLPIQLNRRGDGVQLVPMKYKHLRSILMMTYAGGALFWVGIINGLNRLLFHDFV